MLFKVCIEETLIGTRSQFRSKLLTNIIIHKSNSRIKINFTPVPVNNFAHFFRSFFYVVFFLTIPIIPHHKHDTPKHDNSFTHTPT